MRKFLEENIGNPAELTLTNSGQTAKIAGNIAGVRDNIVLLQTENGLLAGDMNHLLFAKILSPQNNEENRNENAIRPTEKSPVSSAKFAPVLNMPSPKMQTIF